MSISLQAMTAGKPQTDQLSISVPLPSMMSLPGTKLFVHVSEL